MDLLCQSRRNKLTWCRNTAYRQDWWQGEDWSIQPRDSTRATLYNETKLRNLAISKLSTQSFSAEIHCHRHATIYFVNILSILLTLCPSDPTWPVLVANPLAWIQWWLNKDGCRSTMDCRPELCDKYFMPQLDLVSLKPFETSCCTNIEARRILRRGESVVKKRRSFLV